MTLKEDEEVINRETKRKIAMATAEDAIMTASTGTYLYIRKISSFLPPLTAKRTQQSQCRPPDLLVELSLKR
jgi:hypothetical protein